MTDTTDDDRKALAISVALMKRVIYMVADAAGPPLAITAALGALLEVAHEQNAEETIAEAIREAGEVLGEQAAH